MTTRATSARTSSARRKPKAKRRAAPAPPRDPNRLTPAEVIAHPHWGPLLRNHIPKYDPCALAEGCYFDVEGALKKLRFFERFIKHVKGPLHGHPFTLLDWQQCIVANAHGWRRLSDGTRRYKVLFIYCGKKQGKTAFLAAWVLSEMADAPAGSEIYSAAAAQKQAGLLFEHVAGMIRLNPIFEKMGFQPYGYKGGTVGKSVTVQSRLVSYKCLAADADTVDGINPYLSVIDELHRHKKPELSEVLETSAVQPNAMTIFITTADHDRPSVCNAKRSYALSVRSNTGKRNQPGYDPTFLPCIWEADVKDDWRSLEVWHKANPSLGITKSVEFMREQCRLAQEMPSKLNGFLRLHLNIVTSSAESYLPMGHWDQRCCGPVITPGQVAGWIRDLDLEGRGCYAAIDLAKTGDLNAFVKLFPPEKPDGKFVIVPRFWMPEEGLRDAEERDGAPYSQWVREGFMELTPGNVTDYSVIEAAVVADSKRFPFAGEFAYDSWNASQFAQRLKDEHGIQPVEFIQGYKSYHPSLTELERLTLAGLLVHGGHPVLRWCATNLKVVRDDRNNVKPTKKRSTGKIDGITALCMALGVLILTPQQPQSADKALLEEPIYE